MVIIIFRPKINIKLVTIQVVNIRLNQKLTGKNLTKNTSFNLLFSEVKLCFRNRNELSAKNMLNKAVKFEYKPVS